MEKLTKKEFEQEIKKVNYLAKMVYMKGYPNTRELVLHATTEDLGEYLRREDGFSEKENIYKHFSVLKKRENNQVIVDSGFDIKYQDLTMKYEFDIAKKIMPEFDWKVYLIEFDYDYDAEIVRRDGGLIEYEQYLIGFEYSGELYTIGRSSMHRKNWADLVDLVDVNKDLDFTIK